jgi:hypothetical protein
MTQTLVIEINEARIVVAGDAGLLHFEPGYALVNDGQILTGRAAFAKCRTKPQQVSNNHWSTLSDEHGSAGVSGLQTSAELAHAQLEHIWKQHGSGASSVILVVPSDYSKGDLGVLLGVAMECGMPVSAMVDAAVAASVRPYPNRQLLYVDCSSNAVTVTPLEQGDEVTSLEAKRLDTGLSSLMDAYAIRVAEIFVLATRFDPMHQAATEQLLYDNILAWLEKLRDSDRVAVEIQFAGDVFQIELERAQLLGVTQGFSRALQQLIAQIRQGASGLAVQLSDKLAVLPGIAEELARLDDVVIINHEPGHAALALLDSAILPVIDTTQVKLYRHLPWRAPPANDVADSTAPDPALDNSATRSAPTHLVYRGIAYRVNGEGVVIGRTQADDRMTIVIDAQDLGVSRSHCAVRFSDGELRLSDLSSYGTFVNELKVEGEAVLKPADVIRVGSPGAELTAVFVGQDDGA